MEGLADFITDRMPEWKVPGLAIAVVKDDQIIFCEGFGFRDLKSNLKVTPKTLFAIGSCTKAFTTMAMGILCDRGKLDWDKPVRNYIPTFKLYDSYATEHMTPRDLVTHRSGLPRHDAMWYGTFFTRQELFDRLQYLEPTREFRTVFQYQNLMYMAAGYLVGQIAGSSWEDFVQQEILHPLGMGDSNFSVNDVQKTDDFVLPYMEKEDEAVESSGEDNLKSKIPNPKLIDEVKQVPFRNTDAIAPAGSIYSNVTEMAQWLLLHLNQGKIGDKQLISPTNLSQMHSPQIVAPDPQEYREILNDCYGLGWGVFAYRGHNLVQHGGGIDGFSALTTLLPQDNIGIVVLTNLGATPLPSIVTFYVCDRLLNLEPVSWNERIKTKVEKTKEVKKTAKEKLGSERIIGTQPSHALADYTGDYEHPAYGIISVRLQDNQLTSTYHSFVSHLEHFHYDTFLSTVVSEDIDLTPDLTSFFTDKKGNISSLCASMEPALKDAIFTRIADKGMTETSFLEKFVGDYELADKLLKFSLRGNRLFLSISGQPDYELVPYKDTEFNLKDLSGFSVKFIQDAAGIVVEAVLDQPNGIFTATKK